MLKQLEAAREAFHVRRCDPSRYAARPRLISTLSGAITDCQEIDVEQMADDGRPPVRLRLQPLRLVIEPPAVRLLAIQSPATNGEPPLLIDIETIGKVTTRDVTFVPPPADSIRVE
jgi:hypothetical protein